VLETRIFYKNHKKDNYFKISRKEKEIMWLVNQYQDTKFLSSPRLTTLK